MATTFVRKAEKILGFKIQTETEYLYELSNNNGKKPTEIQFKFKAYKDVEREIHNHTLCYSPAENHLP